MGNSKRYGNCVPLEDTAKQKLETPKGEPEATPRVVTYVTQRWRCSEFPGYLEEEANKCEEVDGDCELLVDQEEEENVEHEDVEGKEDVEEMQRIKESFQRFLKTT